MRVLGRVVAVLVPALAPAVFAAPIGEPLSVEWKAHGDCPEVNDYWRGIVDRSSRIRRASTGEQAIRARIEIRKSGDRSVGTLTLGGAPREVAAATCGEVIDALALMTVLALDPEALTTPPVVASTVAPPSATPSATVTITPAPPPPPPPSPTTVVDVAPPQPTAAAYTFSAAAGGQLLAIGHGAAHGAIAAAELRHGGSSVRLTFGHANSELIVDQRGPGARFAFDTGRFDACPWSLGDAFRVTACAGLSGGVVTATPQNVIRPKPQRRPWFAAHIHARSEIRLTSLIGLEAEVGVVVPFVREDFVVAPDLFLYRPPAVMLSSQLALAVHFQ